MTAGNVLTIVLLTLLGVVLFVALIFVIVRVVLKGMNKYGLTGVFEDEKGRKTRADAPATMESEPEKEEERVAIPLPGTPRFNIGDTFKDSNGTPWTVDATSISRDRSGVVACQYTCHNQYGLTVRFLDVSDAQGVFHGDYRPAEQEETQPAPPADLFAPPAESPDTKNDLWRDEEESFQQGEKAEQPETINWSDVDEKGSDIRDGVPYFPGDMVPEEDLYGTSEDEEEQPEEEKQPEDVKVEEPEEAPPVRRNAVDVIHAWRQEHIMGTKEQCAADTGLSRWTVSQWWEKAAPEPRKLSGDELSSAVRGWQLMHKEEGQVAMCSMELNIDQADVASVWDYNLGRSLPPQKDEMTVPVPDVPKKRKSTSPLPTSRQRQAREAAMLLRYGQENGQRVVKNTPQNVIEAWQYLHPEGTKAQCAQELGYCKENMDRYWKRKRRSSAQNRPASPAPTVQSTTISIPPLPAAAASAAALVQRPVQQTAAPRTTPPEGRKKLELDKDKLPLPGFADLDASIRTDSVERALRSALGTAYYPKSYADMSQFARVVLWREKNPSGVKSTCATALGFKQFTVAAWWPFTKPISGGKRVGL